MGKEITFDKFIRWAGVTLIVLAVLYMTNYLSSVLLPFFIAWFFAYLLYPVVKFIENKLHVRIRALSILIAMGTAIAVIGGVLWLIIPPMIDQFDKLGEVLTRWLHQTTHTNNLTALIKDWLQANQEQIEHFLKSKDFSETRILHALATAGLIGNVVKHNASISGAEVGCQGEVGVACAMAAAAATQLFGGSVAQIEYAAEMGLEHHLGMTCDPVCGLVQIPCIERNAYAAARALDANLYASFTDGNHRVSFDKVVEVMKQTGHDLPSLYKETGEGGLAKDWNDPLNL